MAPPDDEALGSPAPPGLDESVEDAEAVESAAALAEPARKVIAVDLDDTLNTFSETLRDGVFPHDAAYNLAPEKFEEYLVRIRRGESDDGALLSTEYSYLQFRIHSECYARAGARAGAAEFLQWLRGRGWRIVIATHRDLRRSSEATRRWLAENGMPFDDLFMALNKLAFCKAWGIPILIDDHLLHLGPFGAGYEVRVFYPMMEKHEKAGVERGPLRGQGFRDFEELKQWIPE